MMMTSSLTPQTAPKFFAAVCLSVFGMIAFSLTGCAEKKERPRDEKVPVTVAVAQKVDVPVQIRAIGNVQPYSTVAVRALVGGQLTRVWFREGEEVRRGQTLFTIDPRPYQAALAQAQANLARDEAQLRNAEAESARYADLVKKDFVTKEEFDKVTAGAEAGRAVVAADRAAIQNARLQLAYCSIQAPVAGRTGSLMVHQGNIVRPGDTTPLVVINQIHPVYVQFSVPQNDLQRIRSATSQRALPVTVVAPGSSEPLATGRLTFLDNAVDASTGTITLKGTFGNETSALWPGQFVNVLLTVASRPDAIVIPAQAVQTGQRGEYVYVVRDGGSVEMRRVSVSETANAQAIIQSGIAPGETVVTDGQLRLTPKSKVEVKSRG